MKTVCWMLIGAIAACGVWLVIETHNTPAPMHMISNPNCFPPGTEGVGVWFKLCSGDIYRAVTFENT